MMTVKRLSYRIVKRKLNTAGFTEITQKGSHVKFIKNTAEGTLIVIVPKHPEITIGTLSSILKQAGLSKDEFENL